MRFLFLCLLFSISLSAQEGPYLIKDKLFEMSQDDQVIYLLGSQGIWCYTQGAPQGELIFKNNAQSYRKLLHLPSTEQLYISDTLGNLFVYELKTKQLLNLGNVGARITSMYSASDSNTLYTATFKGEVVIWNTSTREIESSHKLGPDPITGIVSFKDTLMLGDLKGKLFTWDSKRFVKQERFKFGINTLSYIPFWKALLIGSNDRGIYLSYLNGTSLDFSQIKTKQSGIKQMSYNEKTKTVSIVEMNNRLVVLNERVWYSYVFKDDQIHDVLIQDSEQISMFISSGLGLKKVGVQDFKLNTDFTFKVRRR